MDEINISSNKTSHTKTKHVTINMKTDPNNTTIELQSINTHMKPMNIQVTNSTPSTTTINVAKNIRQLMAEKAKQPLSFDITQLSCVNIGKDSKVLRVQSCSPCISENNSFSDVSDEKELNNMSQLHMSDSDKLYEINLECNDSDKTNVNAECIETKLGTNDEDIIDTMGHTLQGEHGENNNSNSNIVDVIMEELEMDMNDIIKLEAMSSVKSIIDFGTREKGESVISLSKKRSNTLKFINYESNKL